MAIQLLRGKTADISTSSLKVQPGQPLYVTDRNYLAINDDPAEKAVWKLKPIRVKEIGGYFGETLAAPDSSADQYSVSPVQAGQKINYLQLQAPAFHLKGSFFNYEITREGTIFKDNKNQVLGRLALSSANTNAYLGGLSLFQNVRSPGHAVYLTLYLNRQGVYISDGDPQNKSILSLQDLESKRELNWHVKQTFSQDLIEAGKNITCSPEGSTEGSADGSTLQRSKWVLHCSTISIYDKNDSEQAGYKIRYVDVLPSEREPNSIYIVKEYTDVSAFA